MQITYTAIIESNDSRRVWRRSRDYSKLAAAFEAYRARHFERTKTWPGGFITSEAVSL